MSYAPDKIYEPLADAMHAIAHIRQSEDGWRVTTHCMYPSNGLVEVTVRGGARTIVASDEGGAIGEAVSAGIPVRDYDKTVGYLVREQGLVMREGVIHSPQVPIEAAGMAVLLVANGSQDVARWLFEHTKVKRTRDFRALLADFLTKRFDDRVTHNAVIVGNSNKPHKFANVVLLPNSTKRLIIDPVANEASSVNARVVANMDIAATKNPNIIQRIVYDDEDEWTAADLNLLGVGAPVVPFSKSHEVIERIAAGG